MHGKFKTPFRPFARALRQVTGYPSDSAGITTVDSLAEAGECSPQTIYNCMNEATMIREDVAHRIMRDHPNEEVRRILAESRLSGTEFHVTTAEGETDKDRDGQTTAKDVLLTVAEMCAKAAEEARDAAAACVDGRLSQDEAQQVVQGLQQIIQQCHQGIGQVAKVTGGKFRARLSA